MVHPWSYDAETTGDWEIGCGEEDLVFEVEELDGGGDNVGEIEHYVGGENVDVGDGRYFG